MLLAIDYSKYRLLNLTFLTRAQILQAIVLSFRNNSPWYICGKYDSHTFLTDNHVRLHISQNASYTGDVCDLHLTLTAKPHICVICGTFHTEVNTHLPLCSTHNLLIKR